MEYAHPRAMLRKRVQVSSEAVARQP